MCACDKALNLGEGTTALPEQFRVALGTAMRGAAGEVLRHLHTIQPRYEALDISHNESEVAPGGKTFRPNDVVPLAPGASVALQFIARPGHMAQVSAYEVRNLALDGGLDAVEVRVEVGGQPVGRIPRLVFRRPVTLDRNDTMLIYLKNNGGANVVLSYALEGWLLAARDVL